MSADSVSRNTHARVEERLSKVSAPLLSTAKSGTCIPVLRARRAASALVMGMVVSRQHAEHPVGMQGSLRAMPLPSHPPYSRRGGFSARIRAIRVVWISFRPSEPETGVRILHRPPCIMQLQCRQNSGTPGRTQPWFMYSPRQV